MSQIELFNDHDIVDRAYENPMVVDFGKGPDKKKCKTCKHFYSKQYNKKYYKCGLRGDTNGPGTDHRVNYHACKFYEEERSDD